ncbi:MAG: ABC transporter substrate-binding protein [Anaerolineae bacterium]
MQNRTKFLVLLLVVALLLPAAAITAQDDTIEIVFSHAFGDANRQGWVESVIEAFEAEHPNIKVTAVSNPSYRDTLNGAILAAQQGNAPHIVQVFEVGSQLALDSGIFIPVSSIANEEQLAGLADDVIPAVRDYYSLGEDQWSLPWNSSNAILYYNKTIFEAAGLDPEDPPETYGEVFEVCEVLMAQAEELGLQGCMGWNMHSWFVEQWMAEQQAPLANNENGRAGRATEIYLESDAMKNIFNFWKEMADRGYYIYTGALEDWNGSDALFTGQQVAMHITSTADIVNNNQAAMDAGFEMGNAFLPIPDDTERNGVVIGGASIWLTDGHPQEELEAAVEFMFFLGNTENAVSWHKATGYFPIRFSAIEQLEEEGWFEENPNFRVAFDQLTQTVPGPATSGALLGNFLELRTIIEEAAQAVVDSGVSVDEALAEANVRANESLAAYNEAVGE